MVIPVHDLNPLRRTPWVTYALLAANVIVLLLTPVSLGTVATAPGPAAVCRQAAFYDRYAAIPHELVTDRPLPLVPTGQATIGPQGAACLLSRPPYRKSPPLSVLFSMFLHAGWLHLLGNMLFLVVFGNNIEDRMGKVPYLLFYLVCGYAAAYGFAAANPHSTEPLIGASGAIAGILGAYIVLYPRARVWSLVPFLLFLPLRIPAWIVLGLWFLLQWMYSAGITTGGAGSVAYLAHVFGFLAGALVGLALRASSRTVLYRSSDHLLGGLHGHSSGADLSAEPVQQRLHGSRRCGVRVAAVADVVEGQLHPAAAVLLGGGDVALDGGQRGALLGVGRGPGRVRVSGRDRLGEHGPVVDPRDGAAAVVSAVLDDLRLHRGVDVPERVGEGFWLEAVIGEIHPVLADLEPGIGELELLQVDVIDGVARDLVPAADSAVSCAQVSFPAAAMLPLLT